MKANHGLALPVVVSVTALLGLAVMAWLPSKSSLSAQTLRYKHQTWWHWQQAVAHFFQNNGRWPESLAEVRTEFGLADEPSFIEGYKVLNGFRIRITGIGVLQKKHLVSELKPHVIDSAPNSLDVELSNSGANEELSYLVVARYQNSVMDVPLDMNSHSLVEVNAITINGSLNFSLPSQVTNTQTQRLEAAEIKMNSQIFVDSFHTTEQANAIDVLTARIRSLYYQLDDYMNADEAVT